MKPGDVLEEDERHAALAGELDEVRSLEGALGEEDAVVREDPDRKALDVAEPADEGLAVERLELVEVAAVDDAGDDLADVVALCILGGHDSVEVLRVVEWLGPRLRLPRRLGRPQAEVATISRTSASACSSETA
jgi:hypothetical protein